MEYIIGMDGGGTGTYARVCKTDGTLLYAWKFGALNVNGQTNEQAAEPLKMLLTELKAVGLETADCAGICVGAAGISNGAAGKLIRSTFEAGGIRGKIVLAGDHETALAAASKEMWGVILIAGTGSICYGRDEAGISYRAGGYGHLIDDAGGGYAIGRDILKAIVRGIDGREKPTLLQEAVFQKLGCHSAEELISWLYALDRTKGEIAALAVLLDDAVREKDAAAERILQQTAEEQMRLVDAVLVKMKGCRTLVLGGSVLLHNERIRNLLTGFLQEKYPELAIVKMEQNAAEGAIRILQRELKGYNRQT